MASASFPARPECLPMSALPDLSRRQKRRLARHPERPGGAREARSSAPPRRTLPWPLPALLAWALAWSLWITATSNGLPAAAGFVLATLSGTSRNLPCSPEPGLRLHKSSAGEQLMSAARRCPHRRGTPRRVFPPHAGCADAPALLTSHTSRRAL